MKQEITTINNQDDDKPLPQKNNGNGARASWKISLDILRTNIAHCRPEAKQAIVDCFLWCTKNDIMRQDFAEAIDISENVLYKVVNGSYKDPNTKERLDISPKMLANMQKWLKEQKAHASKRSQFIMTPTAKKVLKACDFARESKTPVFLFGPSHIGKTWALEHESETNNHGRTPYFRMRAAGGILGLLKLIAAGVGVSPNSNAAALKERIFNALDSDMVLLFDEMHELLFTYQKHSFFACIEFIREIHDIVGCGMVLSFTNWGRDQIMTEKNDELNQIFRRGVHRFQLPKQPLKKDLELILAYHGLDMPTKSTKIEVLGIGERPLELMRQLGLNDGLKSITERIRYAKKLAILDKREKLKWEDVIKAHILISQNANEESDW